jgi:transketolase
MRKQFVKTIEKILDEDKNTVLLLGDIGVFGFRESFKKYPERVYNIGILEQSSVSLASGLSMIGLNPIFHTIAPFLVERSLEQLKVDFGYQNLNGNFFSIGSSYDYAALGCTHHCPGDISQLLTIPNMEIITPGTSEELNLLIGEAYVSGFPTYYRLSEYENEESQLVKFKKGNVIKEGKMGTIICFGNTLHNTIKATEDLDVTILYYTTVNPFDDTLLIDNFNEKIIVVEPWYEGSVNYKISKCLENKSYKLFNIGVPHKFLLNYGTKLEHDNLYGLDIIGLKNKFKKWLE